MNLFVSNWGIPKSSLHYQYIKCKGQLLVTEHQSSVSVKPMPQKAVCYLSVGRQPADRFGYVVGQQMLMWSFGGWLFEHYEGFLKYIKTSFPHPFVQLQLVESLPLYIYTYSLKKVSLLGGASCIVHNREFSLRYSAGICISHFTLRVFSWYMHVIAAIMSGKVPCRVPLLEHQ